MSRRSTVWKLFSLVRYLRQRLQVSGSIPSIWFGSFNIYCPSSVSFIQWRPNATRSTCMILIARICNPVTQCFTLKDHQVHLHLGNSFKCAPVIWNHEADINPPPIFIRQFWRLWFYCPWSTTFPSIPHWSSIPTSRHTTVMLFDSSGGASLCIYLLSCSSCYQPPGQIADVLMWEQRQRMGRSSFAWGETAEELIRHQGDKDGWLVLQQGF